MNQKEATVGSIISVLYNRGIEYELNGPTPVRALLTTEDRANVREMLLDGFAKGQIEMTAQGQANNNTPALMKKYVDGLIGNWVSKYDGFNCGEKHTTKNPGSRTGSKDECIVEMKKVLSTLPVGSDNYELVQAEIAKRQAEISPTKMVEIDVSALPESLRHLVK